MSRIAALPRRDWEVYGPELGRELTDMLRTPRGRMLLRPVQAAGLWEAWQCGGLFGSIGVGFGKTLMSGLLPRVLGSTRPLLLAPANLIADSWKAFGELKEHWQIPRGIRIESYSKLGLPQHAGLLDAYEPDLIIADEASALKNFKVAAVSRRVARYLSEHRGVKFVALSGSLTEESILDYAHMLIWALGSSAPVPTLGECEDWAACLDRGAENDPFASTDCLVPHFGPLSGTAEYREAYRSRLAGTPGVIITEDSWDGCPLRLRAISVDTPACLEKAFDDLRELWATPDGYCLGDAAFQVYAVARELALGFYYKHVPRPPILWAEARRNWARLVRHVLQRPGSTWDSEMQVAEACSVGALPSREYREWLAIRDTYTPEIVPEWLSDHALQLAERWGREGPGIIWCEHIAFAEELARRTGWPYYAGGGFDAKGNHIRDGRGTVIASVEANHKGRNLQHQWHRNLLPSYPNSARLLEQLAGRTHRCGQLANEVVLDYFLGCKEHALSVDRVYEKAEYIRQTTGQKHKILGAEHAYGRLGSGPAWR